MALVKPKFTDREIRTLKLVAKGMTNLEISKLFVLSESAVGSRICRMLFKLGARNRTHLVHLAYQYGYLEVQDAGSE